MSKQAQYGMHPDVDVLSAFAEGVLAEHERLACLDHLASCAQCREIVYLTQAAEAADATPEMKPTREPVPFWKRWLAPAPILSTAAVAALVTVSVAVYRHQTAPSPQPELMAKVEAPPAKALKPMGTAPQAVHRTIGPVSVPPAATLPEEILRVPQSVVGLPAAAPPPVPTQAAARPPAAAPPAMRAFAPAAAAPLAAPSPGQLSGVGGTITDSAGAAIANAQVELSDSAREKTIRVATNSSGQYAVSGVPPGLYELSVDSPGFKQARKQVDLQPEQVAKADSVLTLGNVSESIAVTAEVAPAQTSASAGGRGGRAGAAAVTFRSEIGAQPALPNAASGRIMLKSDATGALSRSTDAGKSWQPVIARWHGKVVRLTSPPDAPGAGDTVFQLNTDAGEIWFSRDGNRWTPAAPAH